MSDVCFRQLWYAAPPGDKDCFVDGKEDKRHEKKEMLRTLVGRTRRRFLEVHERAGFAGQGLQKLCSVPSVSAVEVDFDSSESECRCGLGAAKT